MAVTRINLEELQACTTGECIQAIIMEAGTTTIITAIRTLEAGTTTITAIHTLEAGEWEADIIQCPIDTTRAE